MFVVRDLNVIDYNDAFSVQKESVKALQQGQGREVLYLLEHRHVITLGRNASTSSLVAPAELLYSKDVALVETDRGGDITYHGPGQLVGYPILRLEPGRRDIRRFVTDLEEALVTTLAEFGIEGHRDPVHRGIWVKDRKIASLGIRIARWVTSHGFALNVSTDLSYFSLIHPCGIMGCQMTSLSRELGKAVEMQDVKDSFVGHFAEIFDRVPVTEAVAREMEAHG